MGTRSIRSLLLTVAALSTVIVGGSASPAAAAINGTCPAPVNGVVYGTSGHDFINCSSATGPLTIDGLSGHDRIVGTSSGDTIYGNSGNDCLDGGPGDDVLYGGSGNDGFSEGVSYQEDGKDRSSQCFENGGGF